MHINIEKGAFLRTLNHAASVIERRNTIPILSHVRLQTGQAIKDSLILTSTDLQRQITEHVSANVFQPGAICVNATMLHDIIRKFPDGCEVQIKEEPEEPRIIVSSGRSRFKLLTLPASDYPTLDTGDHDIDAKGIGGLFSIPAVELKMIIEKTRFAMSTEETRYYLNGIYFHVAVADDGSNTLRAVATDGHRLARVDVERPDGCDNMPGVIIPRKTVDLFHRLISDQESDVEMSVTEKIIKISVGGMVLHSKLVDGTYPDYDRAIPKDNDISVIVPTPELFSAVDRVATVAGDKANRIRAILGAGMLKLEVKNADAGDAVESIDVNYHEDELIIGFNSRYILAVLSAIDSPKTLLKFSTPSAPVHAVPENDDSKLFIIMPMRA